MTHLSEIRVVPVEPLFMINVPPLIWLLVAFSNIAMVMFGTRGGGGSVGVHPSKLQRVSWGLITIKAYIDANYSAYRTLSSSQCLAYLSVRLSPEYHRISEYCTLGQLIYWILATFRICLTRIDYFPELWCRWLVVPWRKTKETNRNYDPAQ
jgi:hypothetical protein